MAGIGSPKGVKQGGRKKGTPNKATAAKVIEIEQSGLTPLAYMLNLMRDETQEPDKRLDAAKSAAPYVHPKLANIEHGNLNGKALMVQLLSADADL